RFDCDWSSDVCSSDLHYGDVPSLQAGPEGNSAEHGNEISEGGDGRDYVVVLDISEVRGGIATFGGGSGFGHVLHHDVARGKASEIGRASCRERGEYRV